MRASILKLLVAVATVLSFFSFINVEDRVDRVALPVFGVVFFVCFRCAVEAMKISFKGVTNDVHLSFS